MHAKTVIESDDLGAHARLTVVDRLKTVEPDLSTHAAVKLRVASVPWLSIKVLTFFEGRKSPLLLLHDASSTFLIGSFLVGLILPKARKLPAKLRVPHELVSAHRVSLD